MTDAAAQPRTPAGSPDGGRFAACPGGPEADSAVLDEPAAVRQQPVTYVRVEGGIAELSDTVDVIDLDFRDGIVDDDVLNEAHEAYALLTHHDLRADANNVKDWLGDRFDGSSAAAIPHSGHAHYAVLDGGMVQYESDGVAVIDMDFLKDVSPDAHTVDATREREQVCLQFGLDEDARRCREWLDETELGLSIARLDAEDEFAILAESTSDDVRQNIALHPDVPMAVLARLCDDDNAMVRETAERRWDSI